MSNNGKIAVFIESDGLNQPEYYGIDREISYYIVKNTCFKGSGTRGKISPFQAPFPLPVSRPMPENSVKSPFSVCVENTPESRFDCQNEGEMNLS
jgi:hypothetical protein